MGSEQGRKGGLSPGLEPREGLLYLAGEGRQLGLALGDAADQLTAALWSPVAGGPGDPIDLICYGPDARGLFLSWVEMLLYVMDARRALLKDLQVVAKDDKHLRAKGTALAMLGPAHRWPGSILGESAFVKRDPSGLWRVGCQIVLREPHGPAPTHSGRTEGCAEP